MEAAAAKVAGRGCDDSERERCGDGGVEGVTASLKYFDSCLRAKLFVGSDHAMAGANGLSRPTLGTVGTVTEFRGSLAPNQRRRQAKYENAEKDRISHTHCNSKTLSDSPNSVKAGRSEWMTKPLLGLTALNVSTNLANTNDKPVKAVASIAAPNNMRKE